MNSVLEEKIRRYGFHGTSHAYVADGTTLYTHDATKDKQNGNQLFSVSDSKTRGIISFKWSPNSLKLAFRTDSDASSQVGQYQNMIVDPDGNAPAQIANGRPGSSAQVDDFTWSPDSRYLAQRVVNYPSSTAIGVNVVDTTGLSDMVTASKRVVTSNSFGALHWAHSGNQLAFEAKYDVANNQSSSQLALIVYDADTQTLSSINNTMAINEALTRDYFLWSPNDASIAYLTYINGGGDRLYIAPADTSGSAVLTAIPANLTIKGLSWSGDSSKLGAEALDTTGGTYVGNWYIFGAQGQQLWKSENIYPFGTSYTMKWSLDDTLAVYSAGAYGTSQAADYLYSAQVENGGSIVVTDTPAYPYQEFEYAE